MESERSLLFDPDEAINALSDADLKLARVIERVGPFTLRGRGMASPFRSLLRAITGQQLSRTVAESIFRKLLALLPEDEALQPGAILTLPDEMLRTAGLSRAKVAAVKDLAEKTLEGIVPTLSEMHQLPDDTIIEHLTQVRGIGRWTVEMLLIFHMGRPDVLPTGDLGIRKGFMMAYDLPDLPRPKFIEDHGERWRPYRSVASWYLWQILDLKPE